MMDWTEPFERLTAPQRLGVAATAAERVLPLADARERLSDALRLVWLTIEGRATSKSELTRALNLALESAAIDDDDPVKGLAASATFDVLEGALGKTAATTRAVEAALEAVALLGDEAVAEERLWLAWAIEAAVDAAPRRATFRGSNAPTPRWTADVSSQNLPLFRSGA